MSYHPIVGKRFNRWPSIYFLGGITITTLIGCPLYLYFYGISWSGFLIFVGMSVLTLLSITAGYHRFYSHKSYQAVWLYHFLTLGFGAAALQQSALKWASLHRSHHQYVDTEKDPYNIKKGFFYAHVGWILFWIRSVDLTNVKDLQQNRLLMHQHRHFQIWAAGFGVVLPLIIGFACGELFEAALFGIGARLFIVFQVTFFINSFVHTFGSQKYGKTISARDNWLGSLLTFGEGNHSFHHRFPNDYRNGIRWYHWDPGKWAIYLLSRLGLVWDLKRTSKQALALF
ncbi:MAG: fatty acid desaturase [Candidatus Omnitrophota bacterium]|nr:fatty acid desaturase [Candidatus Omnitrophota bacterium]